MKHALWHRLDGRDDCVEPARRLGRYTVELPEEVRAGAERALGADLDRKKQSNGLTRDRAFFLLFSSSC